MRISKVITKDTKVKGLNDDDILRLLIKSELQSTINLMDLDELKRVFKVETDKLENGNLKFTIKIND